MSIKVMMWVWEHGPERPSAKLCLLALADWAGDSGKCWPSMESLAKRSGLKKRQAQNLVKELMEEGWISVAKNAGPGGVNLYQISMEQPGTGGGANIAPVQPSARGGCTTLHGGGALECTGGVQPSAPRTVIEPSLEPSDEPERAIALFNEAAERVGWPKVQKLTKTRRSRLSARLKDVGGFEGWEHAIAKAEASDFLTGRVRDFRATFDWLTTAGNFAKLMEGNYDQRTNFTAAHDEYCRRLSAGEIDPAPRFAEGDPFAPRPRPS